MNIQSTNVSATARISVIPGDPLASGAYDLGNSRSLAAFDPVDQAFTIKAVAMTGGAVLNLATGVLSGSTGGTITGGDGVDADGQTVALTKLLALHIRNTGTATIQLETASATGTFDTIGDIVCIAPGGDFFFSAPTASAFTAYTIDLLDRNGTDPLSFELFALGKQ